MFGASGDFGLAACRRRAGSLVRSVYDLDQAGRLIALDGVRGFAAMLVFHVHLFGRHHRDDYHLPDVSWAKSIFLTLHNGHIGVDIFFVLSGFLFFKLYSDRRAAFSRFMSKRFRRLLPAHVASVAFVVAVAELGFSEAVLILGVACLVYGFLAELPSYRRIESEAFRACLLLIPACFLLALAFRDSAGVRLLANLSLVDFFFLDIPSRTPVTWSLTMELVFYLSLPLTLWLSMRRMVWLLFALAAALYLTQWQVKGILNDAGYEWIPFYRFIAFWVGGALALLTARAAAWARLEPFLRRASLAALVGFPALSWIWGAGILESHSIFYGGVALASFFLIAGGLVEHGIVWRVFTWTPLRALGRVSFSFYLVHYVVVLAVAGWMTPAGLSGMLLHYLVAFGLSLLVATMLYRGVERKYHAAESRPLRSPLQRDEPSIAGAAPSG
jgi:peptidoglycan/LPS O-acetylase OafA/YrhL